MTQPHRMQIEEPGDFWFFAYGSLMWSPPFRAKETLPARLHGYHRSFCVSSETYRGTPERPGLSLGLDAGGSCYGIAYLISEEDREDAIAEIEAREMVDDPIYICRKVGLRLQERRVEGYTLVVNRADRIYAGKLAFEETARRIARSSGDRGPNIDYLASTVEKLDEIGIEDRALHALLSRAREIA